MYRALQFEISLEGIEPRVWRRVLVPDDLYFDDLHYVIQTAMGWENCHLHSFEIGKRRLESHDGEGPFDGAEDESEVPLSKVFRRKGQTARYLYDFGDSWAHRIRFEKVVSLPEPEPTRVLAGARACPPEDSGGAHRYQLFLDHNDARGDVELDPEGVEWFGDFDPDRFSVDEVNQRLAALDEEYESSALEELVGVDFHYDANDTRGPDPDRWRELDEQESLLSVRRYFVLTFGEDYDDDLERAVLLTTIVENQFVLDSPKEVRTTVASLVNGGSTRLEAIVKIGQILADHLEGVAAAKRVRGDGTYERDLSALARTVLRANDVLETTN